MAGARYRRGVAAANGTATRQGRHQRRVVCICGAGKLLTQRNRYRLTGAIFLLAVAAIALPVLFDGEGVAPMHLDPLPRPTLDVTKEMPPQPDVTPAIEARRELKAAIDEDGYARDTGTRIGDPALLPEETEADLKWAVQVGSFAEHANAIGQRDRLLADDYPAFLSNVKHDGALAARVAVGPFINRDDARRAKEELNGRYGFDAVVVKFSP